MSKLGVPDGLHWERGYRVHGLWRVGLRVAHISLPPYGYPVQYYWAVDHSDIDGTCLKLDDAKQQVHEVWQRLFDEHEVWGGRQAVVNPLAEVCDRCFHPPHMGRCAGFRPRLCSRDDGVCGCLFETPLIGQCGDDPREWLHGRLMAHRRDCFRYGTIALETRAVGT